MIASFGRKIVLLGFCQDCVQSEGKLYLIFEFVDRDLKKYMEATQGMLDPMLVKVREHQEKRQQLCACVYVCVFFFTSSSHQNLSVKSSTHPAEETRLRVLQGFFFSLFLFFFSRNCSDLCPQYLLLTACTADSVGRGHFSVVRQGSKVVKHTPEPFCALAVFFAFFFLCENILRGRERERKRESAPVRER